MKCKNCGKGFRSKREWQNFCSKKCRLKFWADYMKKIRKEYLKRENNA